VRCLLLLAAALLFPALLDAQVEPGDRVRVKGGSGSLSGTVVAVTDSTVTLTGSTGALGLRRVTRTVDFAYLDQLERSLGPRSRAEGAFRGAAIGLLGGAAVGGTVGLSAAVLDNCDASVDFLCFTPGMGLFLGGLIGAYSGAPYGLVAGFLWPGDYWERTEIPAPSTLRPTVLATPDGRTGVGVSLRF
jgi:hypothetical protein